jgi:hypothetical protein
MILGVLAGGLGNQLFQIYTTIAYSLENNSSFTFLNKLQTFGITLRSTYWNTFFKSLQPYLLDETHYQGINFSKIKELEFKYNPLPSFPENNDYELIGYFQSYKYFEQYAYKIFILLQINDLKQNLLDTNSFHYDFNNTISIHFRIGDYLKLYHIYPILNYEYYKNALNIILKNTDLHINKKILVLYFCEQKDLIFVKDIIIKLQYEFKELVFECVDFKLQDWEQMLLMSCCNYNIIANSTFSWWAAYFNTNNDKIVCYPNKWIYNKRLDELDDLFPNQWIKVF